MQDQKVLNGKYLQNIILFLFFNRIEIDFFKQ